MNADPQALYRFFDADGRLLYVGVTLDLGARWKHHSKNKTWWASVVTGTVEHFTTREAVLVAEKAAIIAEKPLWNVVHNRARRPASVQPHQRRPGQAWTFQLLRRSEVERTEVLRLYWEINGDPMTDDYLVEEISPIELWRMWRDKYRTDPAEKAIGVGTRRIHWYVDGGSCFEGAPFQDLRYRPYSGTHFLEHYTWPLHPETHERLVWSRLPVVDRLWRPGRADKGGFIQELTGWKPSPLQPFVNVEQLAAMAGVE